MPRLSSTRFNAEVRDFCLSVAAPDLAPLRVPLSQSNSMIPSVRTRDASRSSDRLGPDECGVRPRMKQTRGPGVAAIGADGERHEQPDDEAPRSE